MIAIIICVIGGFYDEEEYAYEDRPDAGVVGPKEIWVQIVPENKLAHPIYLLFITLAGRVHI